MLKSIPNILTISRILIAPIVVIPLFISDSALSHRIATILFLFASITDFFDGYLARIWSIQSEFGKFLDPIADKLLISTIIVTLVYFQKIYVIPAIAIICREILVSGLREFLATLRIDIPVSNLAKIKTAMQMISIFLLLLGNKGSGFSFIDTLGNIIIWITAILTIFTGYIYLRAGLSYISKGVKNG